MLFFVIWWFIAEEKSGKYLIRSLLAARLFKKCVELLAKKAHNQKVVKSDLRQILHGNDVIQ